MVSPRFQRVRPAGSRFGGFPPSRPANRFVLPAVGTAALLTAVSAGAQPALDVRQTAGGVELSWEAAPAAYVAESVPALGTGLDWQPVAEIPVTVGPHQVLTIPPAEVTRFFRLRQGAATPVTVTWTSPAAGEADVSVTRETVLRLSAPLAQTAGVTGDHLYAEAAGRRLLVRPELNTDRRTLTLFYLEPLPAGAWVEVTLDGAGWTGAAGEFLDLDGDGLPGGAVSLRFQTANTAPLANTGVTGRILASEPGPGGLEVPLPGVTITVDGREESLRAATDAQGYFLLQPCPAGRFYVNIDGRTSPLSQWPGGAYYPVLGKGWEAVAGRTNNLAGGTGTVYLPLIAAGTLQPVSATGETRVTFPEAVVQQNPLLAGVEIRVPPNSLFADNGTRGGSVGLAPVASDRLPEPLPAGLHHAIDISIQTSGPQNFDQPVPARFPNLPDPVTGEKLPPGAKTALWSFNHDTGQWEMQGPMTVTADGHFVETDPGVGIRQPGWHGASPGSTGNGGPGGSPPCSPPGILAEGTSECDQPNHCPDDPSDAKRKLNECQTRGNACTMKCWEDCGEPGRPEGWLDVLTKSKDCAEAARCSNKCLDEGRECKDRWFPCVLGGGLRLHLHGGPRLANLDDDHPALVFARQFEEEIRLHNTLWIELYDTLAKAPTYDQLPPADRQRVTDLNTELRALYGGRSPAAYYAERERQFVQLVLDSPYAGGTYPAARGYYVLEDLDSGLVRRGRTDPRGYVNGLVLRPDNPYRIAFLLGPELVYHEATFTSAGAGRPTFIPYGSARVLSATDADADRIPAEAEFVLGTRDDRADTDGDGVNDRQELLNGTHPLDGQPPANGVVAALSTPGEAVDVAIQEALALVATGAAGAAVVSLENPLQPGLLAQVKTPGGNALAVAFAGPQGLVADGPNGLLLLDLTEPASPVVTAQRSLGADARAVTASGGLAFVGLANGRLVAVDLLAGTELSRIALPGSPAIEDVVADGNTVWVWAGGWLHAVENLMGTLEWRASANSNQGGGALGRRMRLSLGRGLAYGAFPRGVAVFDIANPSVPALRQLHDTPQFGWKHLLPVMPTLGLAADGTSPLGDEPQDLSLYALGPDGAALGFLGSFVTPGVTRALAFNSGLAFVADGPAGLQVLNIAPADTAGLPPTITFEADFPLDPPRIESGQRGRLVAHAVDDALVRWVEFRIDGVLARRCRTWPFEIAFTAPDLGPGTTNIVFEVTAVDMAGNTSTPARLEVALLPDATPPRPIAVLPPHQAVIDPLARLLVRFSEPLDFQSITPARVRLHSAGPDLEFGTGDDLQPAGTLDYVVEGFAVQFNLDQPLPHGLHRFEVDGLRDLAGNVQTEAAISRFWIAPGGADGDADGDGLANAAEGAAGTSPFAEDTDGDGWADEVEVNDGTDPADPASRPRFLVRSTPPASLLLEPVAEVLPAIPGPVMARPAVALLIANRAEDALPGPYVARPPALLSLAPSAEEAPPGPSVARPPVTLLRNPESGEAAAGPHVARPPVTITPN